MSSPRSPPRMSPVMMRPRGTTSPIYMVSEKNKKYDRQLRLWGDHGQRAIEEGHVCVINGSAVGAEVLKNLVLPGMGSFTLIDGSIVDVAEVETNFFLESSSVGRNRGQSQLKNLLELNDAVKGNVIEEDIESLLESPNVQNIFKPFTVVVATNVYKERLVKSLSQLCDLMDIPLIMVSSAGMFCMVRLQAKEHVVVESHPDNILEDLRLDMQFNELNKFVSKIDLTSPDSRDLSHVPALVLVAKSLAEWRKKHNKGEYDIPMNYKEKKEVEAVVRGLKDIAKLKFSSTEFENFAEAAKDVNSFIKDSSFIPMDIEDIMVSSRADHQGKNHRFWLLSRGLDHFVEKKGHLPLRGTIPDMTSDSRRFLDLQLIYQAKAKEEARLLLKLIQDHEKFEVQEVNKEGGVNELMMFCKQSRYLKVIRTHTIASEYEATSPFVTNMRGNVTREELANDSDSCTNHYLMFRAIERFMSTYNRIPGDEDLEQDMRDMSGSFKKLMEDMEMPTRGSRDELIKGYVSFASCPIHSVASFVGGVVAQEVIKLVTNQWIPMFKPFVYNGITSSVDFLD